MYDLKKIDLGNDEAEHDTRLREYFVETTYYANALSGKKTIVIGRKGSGKSAIFTLLQTNLKTAYRETISITPDQYAWSALKAYTEQGILPEQAHTNAWKLTLLAAVLFKLTENNLISKGSRLLKLYKHLNNHLKLKDKTWLQKMLAQIRDVKLWQVGLGLSANETHTPLRIIDELVGALLKEWPQQCTIRILIDRLDDSWDASETSKNLMIGILKACSDLNAQFGGQYLTTIFIRSDIYDWLFFNDQDKLRQHEEVLLWTNEELKAIVVERVRTSLKLDSKDSVWDGLFSDKPYRSNASAEKYIIDRTFKRPRDMISFVRFAIESAIKNGHSVIEPADVLSAEETKYSQNKYKDLIIEYQKQFPFMKDLLDSFSGSLHKLSKSDLLARLRLFVDQKNLGLQPVQLLRFLFISGAIGVKRKGGASVGRRGGEHFYYYYDDQSINPLSYDDFFIHLALRKYLNISEKRERLSAVPPSVGGKNNGRRK